MVVARVSQLARLLLAPELARLLLRAHVQLFREGPKTFFTFFQISVCNQKLPMAKYTHRSKGASV